MAVMAPQTVAMADQAAVIMALIHLVPRSLVKVLQVDQAHRVIRHRAAVVQAQPAPRTETVTVDTVVTALRHRLPDQVLRARPVVAAFPAPAAVPQHR